jgi:hypothetical protein
MKRMSMIAGTHDWRRKRWLSRTNARGVKEEQGDERKKGKRCGDLSALRSALRRCGAQTA